MPATVICGVEKATLSAFVGKSVDDIRGEYGDDYGVKSSMAAKLNGRTVNNEDDTYVYDGDTLEFVKESGSKGLLARLLCLFRIK